MKAPLSWLAEFVDIELEPEALADRLTLLGMEVRGIERRGADWRHVVVGELLRVEKHPRADRLSLTTVTIGSGEPLEIVCGATNIAVGQRVPVALPGAILPGDRRIERTEKMGVVSNGMLCSGDELGLTSDSDGILILPPDSAIGAALVDLYGDVVLDIDVKPNRGDALSIVGLAREVAAITGAPIRWPDVQVEEGGRAVSELLAVSIEDARLCPRFVGRWVSGIRAGTSPDRVQMRLAAAGVRPISNVVDASNYVMLELGKPIHVFDAAAVHGGRLEVRVARPGERLTTLDHVDRTLDPETLLIADASGPLSIAGVMGGAGSEVSASTTNVVIESAIFNPVSIRRTAFHYALRSEASLRFEKGQEFRLARIGADRTAQLISAWAGGLIAPGRVDSAPEEPTAERVAFRPARATRLLGLTLGHDQQTALLARVGIAVEAPDPDQPTVRVPIVGGPMPLTQTALSTDALIAVVPSWRRDIAIEADVIEELARVNGYDLVPTTLPATTMPAYRESPLRLRDTVRAALAGHGLHEIVTHALVSQRHADTWAWSGPATEATGEGVAAGARITVTNPLSADHTVLRQNLVGGLLTTIALNRRRGRDDLALFEVGKGYGRVAELPHEWWRLGIALSGSFDAPAWNRARRDADIDDLKGLIEAVCNVLGFGVPTYSTLQGEPMLHPGRSALVQVKADDGLIILSGVLGELHPAAAADWDERLAGAVVAELSIRGLAGGSPSVPRSVTLGRHPVIERDVAVVVSGDTSARQTEDAIRSSGGEFLRAVTLFDIYRGAPLDADQRSLAYRLTFGADGRALAEGDLEGTMATIVAALIKAGGRIRT